jgi:membrane fusion protein (multidrug efflux system)
VQSISPGTGAEFSLLPAQNASGTWVKVVQRITVRVAVDHEAGDPVLRSGMSATVDIDTGTKSLLDQIF